MFRCFIIMKGFPSTIRLRGIWTVSGLQERTVQRVGDGCCDGFFKSAYLRWRHHILDCIASVVIIEHGSSTDGYLLLCLVQSSSHTWLLPKRNLGIQVKDQQIPTWVSADVDVKKEIYPRPRHLCKERMRWAFRVAARHITCRQVRRNIKHAVMDTAVKSLMIQVDDGLLKVLHETW